MVIVSQTIVYGVLEVSVNYHTLKSYLTRASALITTRIQPQPSGRRSTENPPGAHFKALAGLQKGTSAPPILLLQHGHVNLRWHSYQEVQRVEEVARKSLQKEVRSIVHGAQKMEVLHTEFEVEVVAFIVLNPHDE